MKFELNELEVSRAKEFCKAHDEKHGNSYDTLAMRFAYIFQTSSIGNFISIRCTCGEEKDISDYDSM